MTIRTTQTVCVLLTIMSGFFFLSNAIAQVPCYVAVTKTCAQLIGPIPACPTSCYRVWEDGYWDYYCKNHTEQLLNETVQVKEPAPPGVAGASFWSFTEVACTQTALCTCYAFDYEYGEPCEALPYPTGWVKQKFPSYTPLNIGVCYGID